ncbi:hypothetical protein [Calothrix rhizosoleniae]|uniref:hypothetical protein n=1 Tax=Calothrix rhizosoleniae TaxID=888997 RepID=UPI001178C61A|nr:hypothetical protein [Calothrix rhizosoleniae]
MRDLDGAYQERLRELDLKNQYIEELKNYIQELEKKSQITEKLNISDDDYETLCQGGLFVIGSARSGTSILYEFLNLSQDIFLLGEANLQSKNIMK